MSYDMRGHERTNRAFVGVPTFLRSNYVNNVESIEAEMAVFGVPMDEGSPYMPGMRFAPRSIREHSMRFSPTGFYDIERDIHFLKDEILSGKIVDVGDVDVTPTNVEKSSENVTQLVRSLRDKGVIPVGIGGDHSVSYPILRGFDEPIHVIQFDAHLDYTPLSPHLKYTNGQPFRHISGLENVKSITQVGIRSLRVRPIEFSDANRDGSNIVTMSRFHELTPQGVAELLPAGEKCYVSIDIDALDLSLIPGCVSAEPNGLLYDELRDSLIALAERMEIVGFDLVEVCPPLDVGTGVTSYLAAHTMVEFIGHIFHSR
ncbi:agmatinase [Marinobacterium lutimaris]|uniref:Agmatinase n=1 Tax=Marinobacterium lutimaris TaxID=568106 RepID=A0A1H6CV08_9GAMM|nr:agmatinase [Marinobacterium lutimaris]SEG76246.1 agmatinase [Marinobacterium lutimaris]